MSLCRCLKLLFGTAASAQRQSNINKGNNATQVESAQLISKKNPEAEEKNSSPIHIVLDIDQVLANPFPKLNLQTVLEENPYLKDFADKNLLINAIFPHMIHPGVIEFIQWIFKIPNVKVSFFSAHMEARNTELVKQLLILALGKDYDIIKDNVGVFSKKDIVICKEGSKQFNLDYGELKKDLRKVLNTDNLDNVILIDDDPSYIFSGQERNVMVVPAVYDSPFYDFNRDAKEFPNDMGRHMLSMNRIFCIVEMLKRILDAKNNCLADNLLSFQYKSNPDGTYVLNREIFKEHQFYLDGLRELQKINPKLEFYGGELAKEYFKKASACPQESARCMLTR